MPVMCDHNRFNCPSSPVPATNLKCKRCFERPSSVTNAAKERRPSSGELNLTGCKAQNRSGHRVQKGKVYFTIVSESLGISPNIKYVCGVTFPGDGVVEELYVGDSITSYFEGISATWLVIAESFPEHQSVSTRKTLSG